MNRDLLSLASQWSSSGLTQKEFCNKYQIGYNQLQYWLRKIKQKGKPAKGFIELIPDQSHGVTQSMELHFVNGCRLVFFTTPDTSFIKSLIR